MGCNIGESNVRFGS